MLSSRLRARCSSAEFICTGSLKNFQSSFCKIGRDGTGKAGLTKARGATTKGVLFSMIPEEAITLDAVEGNGYDRLDGCLIMGDDGNEYTAFSYISVSPKPNLLPSDWYLALIHAGAQEHKLDGIEHLTDHPWCVDKFTENTARQDALKALGRAGHSDWPSLISPLPPEAHPAAVESSQRG